MIYLEHPVHGAKYALCSDEALADEKNGWVIGGIKKEAAQEYLPEEVSSTPDDVVQEVEEQAIIDEIVERPIRRRGRRKKE